MIRIRFVGFKLEAPLSPDRIFPRAPARTQRQTLYSAHLSRITAKVYERKPGTFTE